MFTGPNVSGGPAPAPALHPLGVASSFAWLLAMTNKSFAYAVPSTAGPLSAIGLAQWVIAGDAANRIPLRFGTYLQCDPMARCLGCEDVCPSEAGIAQLSAAAGQRSVMFLRQPQPGPLQPIWLQTFVPRLPGQSGVWMVAVHPSSCRLILICRERGLAADILPDGHLAIQPLSFDPLDFASGIAAAAWMLANMIGSPAMSVVANSGGQP